ncbi:ABC transporter substrate-binding protein [Ideonella sp.]|uniref:ABC transporter substrate-binding protein n=1 Tax=Ideonella sp. TaxID=1929293 RepID=UPI0035AE060E
MPLTIGLLAEHLSLDPADTAVCTLPVIAPLYQPLLHIDRRGDPPVPDLAERWEPSADGCDHRFWLREARFHDGTPVRVRDMAWSLSRHVWPGSTSLFAPMLRGLLRRGGTAHDGEIAESFEVDEAQRCLCIRLAAPYVPLPELLAHPMLGVLREGAVGRLVGSGPLMPMQAGASLHFVEHAAYRGPRVAPRELRLVGHDTPQALAEALAAQAVDVVSVERTHQPLFADRFTSTPLRDRWVGALMVNAAGALHSTELRRDFGQMVQGLASGLFGDAFEPFLLPDDLSTPAYRARPRPALDPAEFARRWRGELAGQALRIVYCPGRGPLSEILTALAGTLVRHDLPHRVIEVAEPAQVYGLVAQGCFDVVARGWAQDLDDAEEFVGIYERQAPGAVANQHRLRFEAQVAAARHLPWASARTAAFTAALIELEAQWLCIPVCRDHKRLFHGPGVQLAPHGHEPFKPVATPAAPAAPTAAASPA